MSCTYDGLTVFVEGRKKKQGLAIEEAQLQPKTDKALSKPTRSSAAYVA